MEASRRSSLVSYAIRDIVLEAKALEKSGTKMIYLNIGDPAPYGFSPPSHIIQAAKNALDKGLTGYAPSQGDPELLKTIASREKVSESDVFVTSGLSEGIDFFYQAVLDPGQHIILPSPNYPLYITKQKLYSGPGTENYYSCGPDWEPDPSSLRKSINQKTRSILLINPNNPTGAVYSRKTLIEIANIAGEFNIPIFSDNAYELMVFEGSCPDIRKICRDVPLVVGGSISKNYLYPGARIGWLAFHGEGLGPVKDALQRLCNQRLSVNWEMQKAAIAAIEGPTAFMDRFNHELKKRADFLSREISRIDGLSLIPPKGAFYAFLKINSPKWKATFTSDTHIRSGARTDWDFCRALLKEGVVTVPGSAFSSRLDSLYFRIVFLPGIETLAVAIEKIQRLL